MSLQLPAGVDALLSVQRILVPCDGSEVAFAALSLACDVAKRNGGRVNAVHVISVKRSLPLDAEMVPESRRGNGILALAEQIGSAAGVSIQSELLQARDTGAAIVDEAGHLGVDAIFIGLELKERIGEPTVGAKIDYLLRHAECQVWIFRDTLNES